MGGEGEVWRKGVGTGKGKQRGEEGERGSQQKRRRTCPSEKRKSGRDPREGRQAGQRRRLLSPQTSTRARAPSGRPALTSPRCPGAASQRARLGSAPARSRRPAQRWPRRQTRRLGLRWSSPVSFLNHPNRDVPATTTGSRRASPSLAQLARRGYVPDQDGDRRGPESEHRLLLPQVELVPDRDPDNDGTKISVSITATGDRGRVPLSAARQAPGEN